MKTVLTIMLLSLLTLCLNLNAQFKEQTFEIQQQADVNSKAQELGITAEQLSGMLNSVGNDGSITEGGIEPDAMTVAGFTGENADDFFGASVSSAGDLNGDGYDDIIIGASNYDFGGNLNSGKVYIFFGGSSMDYSPDIIILGENQDDHFGVCVASAGDVNADGYNDVIVGAPQFDYGGYTLVGKAYIFFGGESMDSTPDVEIYGEEATEQLGVSLSSAGDVNGDGIADIIIGAPGYNSFQGRAYLYFGSSTISPTPAPDQIWTGESTDDNFGQSVSSAGDVNGDGFSDVIVGADANDNVATNAGAAYIFFGSTTIGSTYDLKLTGEAPYNYFGCSVSGAGDVNGDGYSDVIVGARYFRITNPFHRGRAYIYYGGSSMDANADIIMDGESDTDEFGYSVSNVGDVNGDGFSDVIVGAPFWNVSPIQTQGRVYIYFGGTDADNIPDIVLDRANFGPAFFGLSVACAGDVDADGYSDILIGAPLATNEGGVTPTGRAFIYKFSATGLNIANMRFDDGYTSILGWCVSEAGDLNGDGFDDFVVGAPYYTEYQFEGRAYVFFGGNVVNSNPDLILYQGFPNEFFGTSVAAAGDINGDGYDDLLVGAPTSNYAAINGGSVYIYLGGAAMDNYPDREIHGIVNYLYLGHDVSGAGDLNSDGFDDFMISATGYDSFRGAVYIHKGSPGITISDDLILYGEATQDEFGSSISNAADLNGDGYDDIIVGAEYNNGNGSSYIYYGGIEMDDIADLLMNGEADEDGFGNSVGTAGDINNDGFSDVIVGAPFNDDGGTDAGKAYVYYGGLAMDNNPDITFVGESEADQFGCSVDKAGDVNNDGFSDVLIGANHNNDVGFQAGKSYIFYGSNSMDNIVDVVMKAEGSYDNFGHSVSTVGDYNNDGLDDVIIGAPLWGGQDGAAYLFLSTFPPVKPNLIFIKDVPYDQGGYVQLKWARSGYDVPGISKITQYLIQRSFPPGEIGFAWETIGSLPATHETFYSYVASTPNDSMTNNSGTFYFRITARTALPEEYWRSNILYGHSVDNLAPLPPMNFAGVLAGGIVDLHWSPNLEGDLKDYVLYRADYAGANPDTLAPYAIVLDTLYTDIDPLSGSSYYYLRARDIHDNESEPVTEEISVVLSANIRIFLEGGYVGGQMNTFLNASGFIPLSQPFNTEPWYYTGSESVASIPENVTDWILIELRSDEVTLIETRAAFIKNDGTLVDLDGVSYINFPDTPEGEYFVVIIHRNHLPVMTADKIPLSNSPPLYDIRTDPSNAYGTGSLKDLGGGYYGIYSGDANGNGQVQNNDREDIWNPQNGQSGYKEGDFNLNGQVQNNDSEDYFKPNNGRGTQVPPITPLKLSIKSNDGKEAK